MASEEEVELEIRDAPRVIEDEAPDATAGAEECAQATEQSSGTSCTSQIPVSFSPMDIPRRSPRLTLPRLIDRQALSPLDIFDLVVPFAFWEDVCNNTNNYRQVSVALDDKRRGEAGKPPIKARRPWKDINVDELKTWLGILRYMGACRMPRTSDYWSTKSVMPKHPLIKESGMSLTRFMQIKQYLHISDPETDAEDGSLWYCKVDPMFSYLRRASNRYYSPSDVVSVDEMMISFVGRSRHTVVVKTKPDRRGYLIYAVVDSVTRFIIDFIIHSNSQGIAELASETQRKYGLRAGVLYHLATGVGPNTKVYADNAFCTIDVLSDLRKINIGAAGTTRSNYKHFPTEFKRIKKLNDMEPYTALSRPVKDVNVVLWSDCRIVTLLSTMHGVDKDEDWILMNRKRPRSGPSAKTFSEPVEMRKIPKLVDDYNKYMGGCDIVDQMRTYYTTKKMTRRNWFPLFFWAIDSTVNNSFVMFKMNARENGGSVMSHREFRLVLAAALVADGVRGGVTRRKSMPPPKRKRSLYVTSAEMERPSSRLRHSGHIPYFVKNKSGTCMECRISYKELVSNGKSPDWSPQLRRTQWWCLECEVPLCMVSSRQCYRKFHNA